MDTLRVRTYNVRFGDAIFITVPDKDPNTTEVTKRHILIDVGNVLSKEGGDDTVFKTVFDDIVEQLDGAALDLYVMTHEHLDHVQGLPYIAAKIYTGDQFSQKLSVKHAWFTASAEDEYYERYPDAKKAFDAISSFINAASPSVSLAFRSILLNNNPRRTKECMDFLKNLTENPHYVYRGIDLNGKHPFREARFSIWAPEEDTSEYYGRFRPMALNITTSSTGEEATIAVPQPTAGVDASDFYNLVKFRQSGFVDNILAIDKAKNNTSIVFSLEWRGWRLLFTGDAELRSWQTMRREHERSLEADGEPMLKPVHFLKVSHHGSHNGTPEDDILDIILPRNGGDERPRCAVISTYQETYSGIPHTPTNLRLSQRCELLSTIEDSSAPYVDVELPG